MNLRLKRLTQEIRIQTYKNRMNQINKSLEVIKKKAEEIEVELSQVSIGIENLLFDIKLCQNFETAEIYFDHHFSLSN